MGYGTRNNGNITTFWPDDTDDTIYLEGNYSLAEIFLKATEKWGNDISLDDIDISSEYIQTDCIYYDRYDPMDYTNFIVITRNEYG